MEDNQNETKVEETKNAAAVASLVLGIITLILMLLSWTIVVGIIGVITGIIGMILGIVAVKKNKNGVGVAGLVTSIIGMVICLIVPVLLMCVVGVGVSTFNNAKVSTNVLSQAEEVAKTSMKTEIKENLRISSK